MPRPSPNIVRLLVLPALIASAVLLAPKASAAGLDDRDSEPVVLTGAQTPRLLGTEPGNVVAFSWFGDRWQQIPVQVDERKMIDFRLAKQSGNEFRALAYADPNTWVEADGVPQTEITSPKGQGAAVPGTAGDPLLDEDDEIALMAFDAGQPAAGKKAPNGVDPATRTPVRVTDPLDPGRSSFAYLFRTISGQQPSAGRDYVAYDQVYSPALSGGYRTGYNFQSIGDNINGPPVNPEASVVKTPRYEIGMPARWMVDRLVIAAGAGQTDILDGDKSTVSANSCGRNELTFSRGRGAFLANIDGPVRAIRSFIGANSGTFTQRDYLFYKGMWESRTYLRVHPGINSFVSAMDLSDGGLGMTYRNSNNPGGVLIDGVQDSLTPGQIEWEQFAGPQGSVTNVTRLDTDIAGATQSSFYQDMADPPNNSSMLCSGDDHSYGAAGPTVTTPLNNTDPTLVNTFPELPLNNFFARRLTWFDGPEANATLGATRSEQTDNALQVEAGTGLEPDPAPVVKKRAKLRVTVKPKKLSARRGSVRRVRVLVRNHGSATATRVKICRLRSPALRGRACRNLKSIRPAKSKARSFRLRLRPRSVPGKHRIRFRATSRKAKASTGGLTLRVRRR